MKRKQRPTTRCMVVEYGFSRKTKSMFKNLIFQTLALISFMGSLTAAAQVYTVANGNVSFDAATPVSSYQGKSSELRGSMDFATQKISFSVLVESITTDNEKRDGHMYELLQIKKNPNVVFEGILDSGIDFGKKTAQTVEAEGNFTLAGTTNKVTIPLVLTPNEKGLQMTASWSVRITDYNVERPTFMFIKVKDRHDLNVEALLKEK